MCTLPDSEPNLVPQSTSFLVFELANSPDKYSFNPGQKYWDTLHFCQHNYG